jgi:DNA-directed RNA polymerase subunit E'/Rpb7
METSVVFEQKISISPREFNQLGNQKLDALLLKKFADENEGRCSVHGWVVPDTLSILSRTMLQTEGGRFTGDLVSWIQVEGKVIYPVDGARMKGYVLKKNKMGIFVMYGEAIQIMVPRDLHIGNEEFDRVQIGEQVEVEIKKSRFQVKDPHILSVGLFIGRTGGAKPPAPAAILTPVQEAVQEDSETEEDTENTEDSETENETTENTEVTEDSETDENTENTDAVQDEIELNIEDTV